MPRSGASPRADAGVYCDTADVATSTPIDPRLTLTLSQRPAYPSGYRKSQGVSEREDGEGKGEEGGGSSQVVVQARKGEEEG